MIFLFLLNCTIEIYFTFVRLLKGTVLIVNNGQYWRGGGLRGRIQLPVDLPVEEGRWIT